MRLLLVLVLLVGLGACSSGHDSPSADPTSRPTSGPSAPGSATPTQPDASDTPACAEVRAGIDAFNAGQFDRTVAHFRVALRLAREQFRTDPSAAADDLLEAVGYYAELAPQDYPESARSSTEFAKYKAITLGQCVTDTMPLQEPSESPGVTA
jgi:hypothetical protein